MSKLLSLSILLLLISCSHSRVEQLSGLQTVELNLYDADIIDPPVVDSKDSVGLYGPESGQQSYTREKNESESVAVVVGPAIYNTIESLRVFQCMNKLGHKVNMVSGLGFGSIISSMYAQGDSVETIRWKIFKQMRKSRDYRPYSQKWRRSWLTFSQKNIDSKKIKLSQISLWMFDSKTQRYSSKEDVHRNLEDNLSVSSKSFVLKTNFLDNEALAQLPISKTLIINTLPKKIQFKNHDDYLTGVFSKITTYYSKIESPKVIIINIESNKKIDDENIHDVNYANEEFCTSIENKLGMI